MNIKGKTIIITFPEIVLKMINKKNKILLNVSIFLLIFSIKIFAGSSGENSVAGSMVIFVFQLGLILIFARLGGAIFEKFELPSVLGEIIVGIIISPYCLGQVYVPGFPGGLFPIHGEFPISAELYSFTTVASIVLLFIVGLETDIETFLTFSFAGTLVGIGGVMFSFIMGDLAVVLFSKLFTSTPYHFSDPVPLFLGVICTATSVSISARILSEKQKMNSPEGVTILSGAVIDDVLGIIVLAIVIGIIKSGHVVWRNVASISIKAIGIWLGFTIAGLYFSNHISRLLKKLKNKNIISVMSFALALLLAGIFEKSGLAMIIGAYTAGLALSRTDLSFFLQDNLAIMHRFFVPIFFCVVGMFVNLKVIASWNVLLFASIYVVFAILSKIIGCSIPALFLDFNLRGALRVGVGMVPRAEVALIMAGIGLSSGILKQDSFSIVIIMSFITMLLSPPVFAKMLESKKPGVKKAKQVNTEHRRIVYHMPNPESAELILNKVMSAFENEGFFINRFDRHRNLYHICRNKIFITMKYTTEKIIFDCLIKDVTFIHTLFYEVIAEFEHIMTHLQTIADRVSIGKKIFIKQKGQTQEELEVSKLFVRTGVKVKLLGKSKEEIIEELLDLLIESEQLENTKRKIALKDLLEREAVMSTGMQYGVALPHAKSNAVSQLICAVGLKKEGIDFDALDKNLSRIFIITLSSKEHPEPHLQFMAEISKMLMDKVNRKKILSCKSDDDLYSVFTSLL